MGRPLVGTEVAIEALRADLRDALWVVVLVVLACVARPMDGVGVALILGLLVVTLLRMRYRRFMGRFVDSSSEEPLSASRT